MVSTSPIVVNAGFTGSWWVEWENPYNAWDGIILLQPEPIESDVFLQVAQTQQIQINSDLDKPPYKDQTMQLQIQITNTGGPPWAPGSAAVSFNLWSSVASSGVVGNEQNIVLGPGQWWGVGVSDNSQGVWPGNILLEPQPIDPSFNVFIPFNMSGVMYDVSSDAYWFYINVQNTDPPTGAILSASVCRVRLMARKSPAVETVSCSILADPLQPE